MRMDRFFLCGAALFAGTCFGAELYVSPAGSDKNPGSAKAPFATIGKAAAAAKAGDTVKIGPGLYREQITFRKGGKKGAPVTFAGTRGKNGEYLTVIEAPGKVLSGWVPAPEIHRDAWKTPLSPRPNLIMMDGSMIAYINHMTMDLPRWKKPLPKEINAEEIWSKFGPNCKRLPGLDFLSVPADIKMTHPYMNMKREPLFDTIGNVLSGWHKGTLYVRFADGRKPQDHRFTASYGEGFTVEAPYLVFRDLHMRGSRTQFRIKKGSVGTVIANCLLMHGGARIRIEEGAKDTVVRNSVLTAGFIRNDLFKLRSAADMRSGMLYEFFKYVIGTSLSDDAGIKDWGTGTKILDNVITQGLIGLDAMGIDCEVAGNVVRELSSVGICTGATTVGKLHHNLVMNCGIPLRLHNLRGKRAKREEYHYRNLYVQARHGGSQTFVHCQSHLWGPDMVNFEPLAKGEKVPRYKDNPPNPVDAGKIWIYHNTFWGGGDRAPHFDVLRLSKRFRMVLPFFVIDNIFKDSYRLDTKSHELTGPNVLYTFAEDVPDKERRDPAVPKLNKVVNKAATAGLWNKNDLPGLPDMTLAPGSPALEAGVDISKPFTVNGKKYPALPGFEPGYFTGRAPAAGAFQQGEDAKKYIEMHRKAEKAIAMLSELKKNAAKEGR